MRVHLDHGSALQCQRALGLSERTGIMGVHSDAREGTAMLRVGRDMRVHLDHGSALHFDHRSALGCISVHWDHGSALGCVRVHRDA